MMRRFSRRDFIKNASATAVFVAAYGDAARLEANALGVPLGLQLYSVRDLLPKDYEGTLHQLGAIGYREVEAAGFLGRSASDVKQSMMRAGLNCVSAHYAMGDLLPHVDEVIQYGKDLGLGYIICSSPGLANTSKARATDGRVNRQAMTLEDWRWNAEQFNLIGERVNSAGMRFGYHNHTAEFRIINGSVLYDELLEMTDPVKVTMELDCGWMVVAGKNPVDYLTRYPTRFSMLHIKDFKLGKLPGSDANPPPSAELGRGSIDYRPIFVAAKAANIKHAFIEQERYDMPPMEALKIDAEYMQVLKV
jgi:sugar phosphate isomerase/epimerase